MDFENILSQLMKNENRDGNIQNERMAGERSSDMDIRGEHSEGGNVRGENIRGENIRGEKAEKMPEKMPEKMMPEKTMPEKMPEKGFVRGAEMGDLPCEAPIAMTYTPWQRKGSPRFTAGEALDRGTLWPGLELPWKNNFAVRSVANSLLGEVQALDFALVELKLYLNTHPHDMEAFQLYQKYAKAYEDKRAAYVKAYGPLDMLSAAEFDRWSWIDDPWPWEYSDRR